MLSLVPVRAGVDLSDGDKKNDSAAPVIIGAGLIASNIRHCRNGGMRKTTKERVGA
jgi:hypothetical protein